MPVDLTEVRELFLEESFESLDAMESSLLDLEVGMPDKELVNSIFRAAHSIKGGAGIFKFERIITFAHAAETLLDEMRNEEHLVTQTLIDLLLRTVDVLRMMLSALQEDTDYDVQKVQVCQNELQSSLKTPIEQMQVDGNMADTPTAPVDSKSPATNPSPATSQPLPATLEKSSPAATNKGWLMVFKPDLSMLKAGNDPINLFRELSYLGELEVKVDTSQVPAFSDIDPHACYLSWDLTLHADVERAAIDEIFEWVEDECELHITALDTPSEEILQKGEELALDKGGESSLDKEGKSALDKEEESALDKTEESVLDKGEKARVDKSGELALDKCEESSLDDKRDESVPTVEEEKLEEIYQAETLATASETTAPRVSTPTQALVKETLETVPASDSTKHAPSVTHHATEANSIRVGIDKVDDLINMVGELVITQSMLDQVGESFDSSRISQLRDGLSQLERNTRELQESVMRIRMLPISFSFNRFPRLVHDLSEQLGKQVELKLSGEHTELDKTVLEKMSDPLVHLVRNALDHGIEMPEQRRAAGKPETGELHLHAFHQGGSIIIQISDDGAGFDLEKIRAKAIQLGLLNYEEHPTTEQLYELIFQPGFSTAEQVSDLSGRGVGMDVVRRNIRALGGTIEVKSKRGQGSTFSIRLPLTLAILDGQLVRVGQDIYILPLLSIIESLRAKPKLVNSFAGVAEVYKLRDDYIPILRLYSLFGITSGTTQLDQGLLVIVEGDGQKIGLFVDELLSQQQIVIKSLESNYKKIQGISGATILGDGSVALILDVAGLIHLFHTTTKAPHTRTHSLLGVRYEQ
jgi:two-component system chemotaxis sensor kinase CheA